MHDPQTFPKDLSRASGEEEQEVETGSEEEERELGRAYPVWLSFQLMLYLSSKDKRVFFMLVQTAVDRVSFSSQAHG